MVNRVNLDYTKNEGLTGSVDYKDFSLDTKGNVGYAIGKDGAKFKVRFNPITKTWDTVGTVPVGKYGELRSSVDTKGNKTVGISFNIPLKKKKWQSPEEEALSQAHRDFINYHPDNPDVELNKYINGITDDYMGYDRWENVDPKYRPSKYKRS